MRASSRRKLKDNPENYLCRDPVGCFRVGFVNDQIGDGLFTCKKFEAGQFLLFYRGKRLTKSEYESLTDLTYAFTNRKDLFIDAKHDRLCLARFINDSETQPNCYAKIYRDSMHQPHVMFVSLCDIDEKVELRYDYGLGGEIHRPWKVFDSTDCQNEISVVEGSVRAENYQKQALKIVDDRQTAEKSSGIVKQFQTEIRELALNLLEAEKNDVSQSNNDTSTDVARIDFEQPEVSQSDNDSSTDAVKNGFEQPEASQSNNDSSTDVARNDFEQPESTQSNNDTSTNFARNDFEQQEVSQSNNDSSTDVARNDFEQPESTQSNNDSSTDVAVTPRKLSMQEQNDQSRKPLSETRDQASLSGIVELPIDEEDDFDQFERMMFLPFQCFFCSDLLYGDFLIAKHIFLEECSKCFDFLSPFFFKFIECKKCNVLIPGGDVKNVEDHLQNAHNENVIYCGYNRSDGNCREYVVDPFQIERVLDRAKRGQLVGRGKGAKAKSKPKAAGSSVILKRKAAMNDDPDYSPTEKISKTKNKKASFISTFKNVSENLLAATSAAGTSQPSTSQATTNIIAPGNSKDIIAPRNSAISSQEACDIVLPNNETLLRPICQKPSFDQRSLLFPVTCQFCLKIIQTHTCLPRHLRDVHKMVNNAHIKIVAKLHYFEKRHARFNKQLFLCSKEDCLLLYTRKAIHSVIAATDPRHVVIKVRKVAELPSFICPPNFINQVFETVFPINKYKFDFNKALENWKKEKECMYESGKRKYCPEKMPSRVTKIKFLINDSNGFEKIAALPEMFNKFEKLMNVRMGSTKAQICRDLRDFVKFCKLALHPPKMEWIWTCENMDAALERFQSTAQSAIPVETQFNQEFKQGSIVSVDQVKECFFKIMKLLVECLNS